MSRRPLSSVSRLLVLVLLPLVCASACATGGGASGEAAGTPDAPGPAGPARAPDEPLVTTLGEELLPAPPPARPASDFERMLGYFPNTELVTHDGKTVRFYDDILRDRIVLISFMYTQCDGI